MSKIIEDHIKDCQGIQKECDNCKKEVKFACPTTYYVMNKLEPAPNNVYIYCFDCSENVEEANKVDGEFYMSPLDCITDDKELLGLKRKLAIMIYDIIEDAMKTGNTMVLKDPKFLPIVLFQELKNWNVRRAVMRNHYNLTKFLLNRMKDKYELNVDIFLTMRENNFKPNKEVLNCLVANSKILSCDQNDVLLELISLELPEVLKYSLSTGKFKTNVIQVFLPIISDERPKEAQIMKDYLSCLTIIMIRKFRKSILDRLPKEIVSYIAAKLWHTYKF